MFENTIPLRIRDLFYTNKTNNTNNIINLILHSHFFKVGIKNFIFISLKFIFR